MQIHLRGVNYELTPEMKERVEARVSALKKYLKSNDEVAEVSVELGKTVGAHQTGRVWSANIALHYLGKRFNAEALEDTLENALDLAFSELSHELRDAKGRERSLVRRGGARVKAFFQGFGN